MTKPLDDLLRKSLDAADRRRKISTWAMVVLALIGVFFMLAMNAVRDQRLQLILGFTGLALLVCAIGSAILLSSARNTLAILKALAMIADFNIIPNLADDLQGSTLARKLEEDDDRGQIEPPL